VVGIRVYLCVTFWHSAYSMLAECISWLLCSTFPDEDLFHILVYISFYILRYNYWWIGKKQKYHWNNIFFGISKAQCIKLHKLIIPFIDNCLILILYWIQSINSILCLNINQ
jgi:hypothetical protein